MIKKNFIRIFCLLFIFSMVFSSFLISSEKEPIYAASSSSDDLASAKKNLEDLRNQQKELEDKLAAAKKDKTASLESKMAIEKQIENYNTQIEKQTSYISNLDKNIDTLENDIKKAEEEYNQMYEKYKERIRANYESDSMSFLEVFLSSKDFSDFLTKYQYVSSVMEYDNQMLKDLQAKIDKIKTDKENQENSKKEKEKELANIKANQEKQTEKKAELANQIDTISNNAESYQAEYAALKKKEAQFEAEIEKLMDKGKTYSGDGFIWPLESYSYISSYFGARELDGFHDAVDIAAAFGTKIYASNSGKVIYAGWTDTGGGYRVIIDHGSGISTSYCHTSKILVSVGQEVKKGETIALVGHSGTAYGNHLHFKVAVNGKAVNPLNGYISKP